MEITLEKIELVKDRTGVSYAEAKAALEKAGGSVVDAIIMIEEEIDIVPKTKAGDQASQIVEKIKALVKKGNISQFLVKKDDSTVVNLPGQCGRSWESYSFRGSLWYLSSRLWARSAPSNWLKITARWSIPQFTRRRRLASDVKCDYSVIADDLKEKGEDAFSQVKEKASSVIGKMKKEFDEFEDDDYFNFDDFDDSVFDQEEDVSVCESFDSRFGELKEKTAQKAGENRGKSGGSGRKNR